MATWKPIDQSEELKTGDHIRMWFRGGSNAVFAYLDKIVIKKYVERDPRTRVDSIEHVKKDGKDYLVCEVTVIEPEIDPVQKAGLDPLTGLFIAGAILFGIGIAPFVLEIIEKLIDKGVEATWKIVIPVLIVGGAVLWISSRRSLT